jgi:L-ribulose-5-phosphate 3-epimerase
MKRRDFLTTGVTAVAAVAFTESHRSVFAAETSKSGVRRALKKAVNLRMIKAPGASVVDQFKMARDAGFDGVEVNLPDDALTTDLLNEARNASGLEIAGVICTPHWSFPLSDPDLGKREKTVKGLQFALRQSGEIGCKRVLLVPGVVNQAVNYKDCWNRSIEGIRRCIEDAERARCHIAVENVWNQFITNPVEALRFLEEINSPWVGWHFDVGNAVVYGWPEHWPAILGKRIVNVHIKEFSNAKANAEGLRKGFNVELGEGEVNWAAVMRALDGAGYEGYGVAEVPGGDAERLKFLSQRMSQLFAS